ncbi:MAG: SRPBCC domain-containing protein [Dehalococcoidales bacterium]|nr:SRPBCC domain-containing protein [Dehalococcoidales bacterium]
MNQKQATTLAQAELTITRSFDAPPAVVWKAWTEPEQIKRWWGPKNYTAPVAQIDFRVGGKYIYCMRSPEGKDYWSGGVIKEIVPMKRITLTDSFTDDKGNIVPATYYGMSPDFPLELQLIVTFEGNTGKTVLTLKYPSFPLTDIDGARTGWNESLDKLAEILK